jgi:hypothetical protein
MRPQVKVMNSKDCIRGNLRAPGIYMMECDFSNVVYSRGTIGTMYGFTIICDSLQTEGDRLLGLMNNVVEEERG